MLCHRFDTDLRKVNDQLRGEKQQREKVQREKDELAASRYTLEQELKVCGPFASLVQLILIIVVEMKTSIALKPPEFPAQKRIKPKSGTGEGHQQKLEPLRG